MGINKDKFMPKFHHKNGNLIVGFQYPVDIANVVRPVPALADIAGFLKVPYEVQQVIAGIDQNMKM